MDCVWDGRLLTEAEPEHHQRRQVVATRTAAEVPMLNVHELTIDMDSTPGAFNDVVTLPIITRGVSGAEVVLPVIDSGQFRFDRVQRLLSVGVARRHSVNLMAMMGIEE